MRWPQGVRLVISVCLMLGLFGLQIWSDRQELARQREVAARLQAEGEQQLARQKADFERWQAQVKARPGDPSTPPLMPPPPVVWQPPPSFSTNYWFFFVFPALLAPLAFVGAAQQRRLQILQRQEEEERTPYTEEDLMEDWEFKIVRCPRNMFDQPAFLESVLQEEARAGWRLVEKFDAARIRLKRPTSQRTGDGALPTGYNPYRSMVGPKVGFRHILTCLCCVGFAICAAVLVILPLFQRHDPIAPDAFSMAIWGLSTGTILFGLLAAGLLLQARRAKKRA